MSLNYDESLEAKVTHIIENPSISEELNRLQTSMENLDDTLILLENHIRPILSPQPTEDIRMENNSMGDGKMASSDTLNSDLYNTIASITQHVERQEAKVTHIIKACEL